MFKIERDSPFEGVRLSNTYAFISFMLVCAIPIIFFVPFYCYSKAIWHEVGFQIRYGALLDGTSKKYRSTLLYPMIFLIRRLAFVASALLLGDYLIAALCVQIVMSMATIFSINLFNILDTQSSLKKETINEGITLILIYLAMCFYGNFVM